MKYRLTVKGQVALATILLLVVFAAGSIVQLSKSKPAEVQKPVPTSNQASVTQPESPSAAESIAESAVNSGPSAASSKIPTEEQLKKMTETVHFSPNQWEISSDEIPKIGAIINELKAYPTLKIVVEGNINGSTDSADSEFGTDLSMKRAQVVAQVLIGKGIEEARIIIRSNGSSNPVTKESDKAWMNRRTQIHIEGFNGGNP